MNLQYSLGENLRYSELTKIHDLREIHEDTCYALYLLFMWLQARHVGRRQSKSNRWRHILDCTMTAFTLKEACLLNSSVTHLFIHEHTVPMCSDIIRSSAKHFFFWIRDMKFHKGTSDLLWTIMSELPILWSKIFDWEIFLAPHRIVRALLCKASILQQQSCMSLISNQVSVAKQC